MRKTSSEKKQGFQMPHIYVILFIIIFLAALASYIIPAGEFDREEVNGINVIIADTFHYIEQAPVTFMEFMTAIPRGIEETVIIIFGILAIGAMFGVIEKAGIIDMILNFLIKTFGNKGLLIIPVISFTLALFVAMTGMIEASLIFLPALLPLFLKFGFDRIASTAIILISTVVGFACGLTTAANVGTAHTIAELPLFSGLWYRAIALVIMLTVGIIFVSRYIKKVQKNPEASLVTDDVDDSEFVKEEIKYPKSETRTMIATFVLVILLVLMAFLIFQYKWYFLELGGYYIFSGIVIGLIAGLKPSKIAEYMNDGMRMILLGAFIVGVARAISVVLADGMIMDTIVYGLSKIVVVLPETVVPVAMMIVQALINFLIPSGSGQAAATMPIIIGIVDLTEMTRQTAVLAFLFGDGFSNIFYPTSGYFMAALAIAKIKYTDWIKFIWPLLLIWYTIAAVLLVIAYFINYGPM